METIEFKVGDTVRNKRSRAVGVVVNTYPDVDFVYWVDVRARHLQTYTVRKWNIANLERIEPNFQTYLINKYIERLNRKTNPLPPEWLTTDEDGQTTM